MTHNTAYETGLKELESLVAADSTIAQPRSDSFAPKSKMGVFQANARIVRALLIKKDVWNLQDHDAMSGAIYRLQRLGLSLTEPVDIFELVGMIPKGSSCVVRDECHARKVAEALRIQEQQVHQQRMNELLKLRAEDMDPTDLARLRGANARMLERLRMQHSV